MERSHVVVHIYLGHARIARRQNLFESREGYVTLTASGSYLGRDCGILRAESLFELRRGGLRRHRIAGDVLDQCLIPEPAVVAVGPVGGTAMASTSVSIVADADSMSASPGPDDIEEYALVVVAQVGQVVGEVGEVVAGAGLQVLAEVTIDRGQCAAAALTDIREVELSRLG